LGVKRNVWWRLCYGTSGGWSVAKIKRTLDFTR
jgi:hypothetical protein